MMKGQTSRDGKTVIRSALKVDQGPHVSLSSLCRLSWTALPGNEDVETRLLRA